MQIQHIYTSAVDSDGGREETGQGPFDVVVCLTNGAQYVASFVTYDHIENIRRENRRSGACLNGTYFWSKNMVLVEDKRPETVRRIVEYLVEEGEFLEAFGRI